MPQQGSDDSQKIKRSKTQKPVLVWLDNSLHAALKEALTEQGKVMAGWVRAKAQEEIDGHVKTKPVKSD